MEGCEIEVVPVDASNVVQAQSTDVVSGTAVTWAQTMRS